LVVRQQERIKKSKVNSQKGKLQHLTRNVPRRADEILEGGSIYWVIKGFVRARQQIWAIERVADEMARKRCALVLDPQLVPTQIRSMRAFQGWRYYEPSQAPADTVGGPSGAETGEMPDSMASELRDLGLL